jgi:hypothetical protein
MPNRPSLDDYVDVAERIQDFKDAHKEGSLQTIGWEVVTIADRAFVVYRAAAYRTPDDERPGMGIAWEPFPGKTPYTKDSELMNAETAAWGRAIVALGLVANRSLASRQEVRNRQADQDAEAAEAPAAAKPKPAKGKPAAKAPAAEKPKTMADISPDFLKELRTKFAASGFTDDWLRWKLVELGVEMGQDEPFATIMPRLTMDNAILLTDALDSTDGSIPGAGA